MLKDYLRLFLALVIGKSALAMEPSFESSGHQSGFPVLQVHEQDEFSSACLKVRALLEARIDENNRVIYELQNNFQEAIKGLVLAKWRNTPQKINALQQICEKVFIATLKTENTLFDSLIKTKLIKFNNSIDDFLSLLFFDGMNMQRNIQLDSMTGNLKDMIQDDLRCFRYIIKKLSPYQAGWFNYIKVSTDLRTNGTFTVNSGEMVDLWRKNLKKFTSDLSFLNIQDSNYVTETINTHCTNIYTNSLLLLNELDETVKKKSPPNDLKIAIENLAKEYGKMDVLFRQFKNPAVISHLNQQYEKKKIAQNSVNTAHEPTSNEVLEVKVIECQEKAQEVQPPEIQPEEQEILPLLVTNNAVVSEEHPQKENLVPLKIPSEDVISKKSKLTESELKKQRRAEKAAQQLRAKAWCQQLYQDQLNKTDFIKNHDLTSDFKWMNDIINPDITITYSSIKGKLDNLTKIKNGAGSRRHFLLSDVPVGRPVACFFHEPHPDLAVKIEKWRFSIAEALKKAGYFGFNG